ncbi:MAG: magnesium-translocating P-type ATPase, partial [Eubacterium sp.]|nr:magnesium-translocating P-type ATPase [Eubacterium sp.]
MNNEGFEAAGLKREQVSESRRKYGSNDQTNKRETSVLHCIRRAFINPFSVILFVLLAVSLLTDILLPAAYGQSFSSVVIIGAMLLLGGFVRLFQELK